jgi:hypothetical protein
MRYPRSVRWIPDVLTTPGLLVLLALAGNIVIAILAWLFVGLFIE